MTGIAGIGKSRLGWEFYKYFAWTQSMLLPAAAIPCERGELEQARQFVARLTAIGQSEDVQIAAGYAVTEAGLLRAEGRLQEALAAAERARAGLEQIGATSLFGKLALVEALEAATALGDTDKARQLLAMLDELRPGELTRFIKAQRARFRGRLAEVDAEPDFFRAEELFRELQTPFYLAVTLLEHGDWLTASGHAGQTEPLFSEARGIFEQLETKPWIERVTAAACTQQPQVPA